MPPIIDGDLLHLWFSVLLWVPIEGCMYLGFGEFCIFEDTIGIEGWESEILLVMVLEGDLVGTDTYRYGIT